MSTAIIGPCGLTSECQHKSTCRWVYIIHSECSSRGMLEYQIIDLLIVPVTFDIWIDLTGAPSPIYKYCYAPTLISMSSAPVKTESCHTAMAWTAFSWRCRAMMGSMLLRFHTCSTAEEDSKCHHTRTLQNSCPVRQCDG